MGDGNGLTLQRGDIRCVLGSRLPFEVNAKSPVSMNTQN